MGAHPHDDHATEGGVDLPVAAAERLRECKIGNDPAVQDRRGTHDDIKQPGP